MRPINHLVSHLERAAYPERDPEPSDGTARLLRLTGPGRRLYRRIEAVAAEVDVAAGEAAAGEAAS